MSRRSLTDMSRAVARRMRERRETGVAPEPQLRRAAHVEAEQRPELLDWVELKQGFDQWPAGTLGAIVDLREDRALVEVADERGHAVDLFPMPISRLRLARG